MSLSTLTRRAQYTGNGVTTVFAFPYYFPAASDLIVVVTTADVDAQQVHIADYSVTGAGNPAGGSITMLVAPASATTVTIYSATPETQLQAYVTDDNFPAASHESALDRVTVLVQQLRLEVDRSMRVPVTNDAQGTMSLLARSGRVLGFDADGDITFYSFVGGIISPQSVQGTANQVFVNGLAGVADTGAVILTLPQDIATTSSVRFGKVGIGQAPPTTNGDLFIKHSSVIGGGNASAVVGGSLNAPGGIDLHPNAYRDITVFTPVVAGDAYASYDAQSSMGGSVALNHYYGYQSRHVFTGSNTLGILAGYATTNMGLSGTGTITFMRGLYVSQPTISGGGSVGQFDGIYMDQLSNATGLVNAIYIAGNNNVFMAGGQFGNSALLTYPAGATTCRGYFTFDQTSQTGLAIMNSNATATGTLVSFCNNGGTVQGSITQTNSTTVAYNTSSDERLKENIGNMRDSGQIIDALNPKVFDWRWAKKANRGTDGGKHATRVHGLIAQEVFKVFPEAVTVGDDELDFEGNPLRPWSMDASKFVPVLIAEVKDIRRRLIVAGIAA